jgi:hypothetical protein
MTKRKVTFKTIETNKANYENALMLLNNQHIDLCVALKSIMCYETLGLTSNF